MKKNCKLIFSYQKLLFLLILLNQIKSENIEISNQGNYSRGIILDNGNILIISGIDFYTYNPITHENITQTSISPIEDSKMENLSLCKIKNGKIIVLVNNKIYIFNNNGINID